MKQDVKVNSELEYVIVKKNTESRKSASIELRVSDYIFHSSYIFFSYKL